MFSPLDPLLHSQLRLAIMSLLISMEEADFLFLKEKTEASAGNLSVQIDQLQNAGYISVLKTYNGKKPQTICKITAEGIRAFEAYIQVLQEYINVRVKSEEWRVKSE